ncbi:hypothetical protein DEO72_LG9g1050 [Vigna unguiculata]|uniref:Uncharacterized protein n=1 Tax=Vigna unguiculata TaxID=3917 RepID=A0A4D6MZK1_VIGUN|nr:hypothetical protein DEO72_LG9g1050 [Vigna unguiculata]
MNPVFGYAVSTLLLGVFGFSPETAWRLNSCRQATHQRRNHATGAKKTYFVSSTGVPPDGGNGRGKLVINKVEEIGTHGLIDIETWGGVGRYGMLGVVLEHRSCDGAWRPGHVRQAIALASKVPTSRSTWRQGVLRQAVTEKQRGWTGASAWRLEAMMLYLDQKMLCHERVRMFRLTFERCHMRGGTGQVDHMCWTTSRLYSLGVEVLAKK